MPNILTNKKDFRGLELERRMALKNGPILQELKMKRPSERGNELSLVNGGSSSDSLEPKTKEMMNMMRILSHDIRGSLVSVGAAVKLIKKGAYGGVGEVLGNELDKVLSAVKGSIGILEDFMGKSFVVNEDLEIIKEPLQLNEDVLEPVFKEISGEIRSHSVMFRNGLLYKSEQELMIRGNRFWLKAVFRNLLRNAIAYGGRGCMVAVGLRDQGDHLRLNVYNRGKTVPQEHRDKLFTKFSTMPRGNHGGSGGMGLGLFLVKEIVERHGGKIAYEALRYGSNFVFTLSREG